MGALDFFNDLAGTLEIGLTQPPERIAPGLLNERATADARIVSMVLHCGVYESDDVDADPRPITEEELSRVVLEQPTVVLRGLVGDPVTHAAPNSRNFTVRDLLSAVEETERQTRSRTKWFGGVDVHHVYFAGIHGEGDGTFSIRWDS